MKRTKLKKLFKSKKGFSLLELICAVVIMAIVVGGTATGLSVSFQSITTGSLKDQASAKAQTYCDIIMSYVENTPASTLFKPSTTYNLFTDDVISNHLQKDIPDIEQANDLADVQSRPKKTDVPYFTVEKVITHTATVPKEDATGYDTVSYYSYKITAYVDYSDKATAQCTGNVMIK